jgi:hypothetical protein
MGKRRKRHRQRQRKRKRQRQRNRTTADKISGRRKFRIWRMEGLVRMEELGKFLGREILRHQMERMEEALKNTKQRNNKQQKHNKQQLGTFT